MFEIYYLGHAAFKIKTSQATVIIDPFDPKVVGLPWKNQLADLALITHSHGDHSYSAGIEGSPFIINHPGEYEVKGVQVFGLPAYHDSKKGAEKGLMTLYLIQVEGMTIAHLGNLGHRLEEEQLRQMENIDILMVPVDGVGSIGPKEAVETIKELEPSIVIPMHYLDETGDESYKKKYREKGFQTLKDFLSEYEAEAEEAVEKIKIKNREDLGEETKIVVMKRTD